MSKGAIASYPTAEQKEETFMKILATDYDNTLAMNGKVDIKVLNSIKKWRDDGNKFGIVTGRDFRLIHIEIEKYNIPFDFLVCATGCVIYNQNLEIISEKSMSEDAVKYLIDAPIFKEKDHFIISKKNDTYLVCSKKEREKYEKIDIKDFWIERENFNDYENVNQFGVRVRDIEQAKKCKEIIIKDIGDKVIPHQNMNCLDITPVGIDKGLGIKILLEKMNWINSKIFVIGDKYNDIPMIKMFNGYTVINANDEVKKEAKAVYKDVGDLIEHNI